MVLGHLQARVTGEDQIGPTRREVPPTTRRAGLQDDGPTLRRTRHGEWPSHGEVRAPVMQFMDAVGVGEHTRLSVEDQRIVVPRVPQSNDRVEELVGAVVALVMAEMVRNAEVLRLAVVD